MLFHLVLSIVLFAAYHPVPFIPSDDQIHAEEIELVAGCFRERWECYPRPHPRFPFYSKPTYHWVGGLLHAGASRAFGLSPLESLSLLSFLSIGAASAVLQWLLLGTGASLAASFLAPALFVSSPSTAVVTLATTYAPLKALLALLTALAAFSAVRPPRSRALRLAGLAAIPPLYAALRFFHLSAIPFLLSAGIVAALFAVAPLFRRAPGVAERLADACLSVAFLGAAVWAGETVLVRVMGATGHAQDFGIHFQQALEDNLRGHYASAGVVRNPWIFYLTIPAYYLLAEPALSLLGIAVGALLARGAAARAPGSSEVPFFLALWALVAAAGISVGENQKLLRTFFPAHLGFVLLASSWIAPILARRGATRRFAASALALALAAQFAQSQSLFRSLTALPHAIEQIADSSPDHPIHYSKLDPAWPALSRSWFGTFFPGPNYVPLKLFAMSGVDALARTREVSEWPTQGKLFFGSKAPSDAWREMGSWEYRESDLPISTQFGEEVTAQKAIARAFSGAFWSSVGAGIAGGGEPVAILRLWRMGE